MPKTVLFACVHNAGRSQIATAVFNQIVDPEFFVALSAGLEPADHVHPEVVTVMKEVGIDLSDSKPQILTAKMQAETAFGVTMGCGERCPLIPPPRRADWQIDDPKGQPIARVREIREDIRRRVEALVMEKGWPRRR